MRIVLSSEHKFPMMTGVSFGKHPKEFPSGSGHHLHDLLARGLAEAGHEVLYLLWQEPVGPMPEGVRRIASPVADVDIHHSCGVNAHEAVEFMDAHGVPTVLTCHLDRHSRPEPEWMADRAWIYVSESLARSHRSKRFVLNGLDPAHYVFSAAKRDYFFFMCAAERAWQKGLETAFRLSKLTGTRLVVAGTGGSYETIANLDRCCQENGAEYTGDVQGTQKADLFAGAKALLFPTSLNEAFGLVLVEALMSGTPVICSDKGACPEVIDSTVGFVCATWEDYVDAVNHLDEIRPETCREFAVSRYHYRQMTAGYLREYQAEIAEATPQGAPLCTTA